MVREGECWVLDKDKRAWNVDGSTSDRPPSPFSSWIKYWEGVTQRKRGFCSYKYCHNEADVGGHIWIARHRVFLAPICGNCNDWENESRRQGGGSCLKAGTAVVKVRVTNDMMTAERRYADDESEEDEWDIQFLRMGRAACFF